MKNTLISKVIVATAFSSLALIIAPVPGFADDVDANTIIKALKLEKAPPGARTIRGIGVEGGDPVIKKIDLKVQFEYDEATLTNEAKITLKALAEALRNKELADLSFKVIGHTDAKGGDTYNQDLSERRAAAVVRFLASNYDIATSRLKSSGEGESRLVDSDNPESGENRRVEIQTILK